VNTLPSVLRLLVGDGTLTGTASLTTDAAATNSAAELQALVDLLIDAPTLSLPPDSGTLTSDGYTSQSTVTVADLSGLDWQYSTDGGSTWAPGVGASFLLPRGSYEPGDIQVRKVIFDGETVSSPEASSSTAVTVSDLALTVEPQPTDANLADDVVVFSYEIFSSSSAYEVELYVDGQYAGSKSDLDETNNTVTFVVDFTSLYDTAAANEFAVEARLVDYANAADRSAGLGVAAAPADIDSSYLYLYH
jgi:hypothetical protein